MSDTSTTTTASAIEDPTSVTPSGYPNSYLLCPEAVCAAPPDGISPTFDQARAALEQAWLALMNEQPRVDVVAEDPARQLYLFRQRSAVFGFPDLISVRFLDTDGGSTLAVYSRAVYGYYDFGVNRRRIEDWVARLQASLGKTGEG